MNEEASAVVSNNQTAGVAVATELKEIVEALLFASDEPVTPEILRVVFDDMNRDVPDTEKLIPTSAEIRATVDLLNAEYVESRRAYRIQPLAGGYIFATEKKFASWVGKLLKEKARRKLSQTAVETLAIIAYKQPITKSAVEFIRGVNADYIMKTLLEKNLATVVGRAHSPGRPLLYGTTGDFLKHFGLNEITDLPKPREIEELLGETELEVEKRMLANQEEMEFKEKLHEKFDPNSRAPHIPRKKSKLQEPPKEDEGKTVVEAMMPVQSQPHTRGTVEIEVVENEGVVSHPPSIEPIAAKSESVEETAPFFVENSTKTGLQPTGQSIDSGTSLNNEAPLEIFAGPERTADSDEDRSEPVSVQHSDEPSIPDFIAPEKIVSTEGVVPSSEAERPEEHGSKKGWSTWKTKIQTFFRKLFG
jgi:segregation and condensation protein B